MFSSHKHIKRKTPDGGIDRRVYIGHLVDEYFTSTNVEALEQVTANLANFAYDPYNWQHLHEANALDVFFSCLDTQNPTLQLHALAALCNWCLEPRAADFIIENIAIIRRLFLRTEHPEIIIHILEVHFHLLGANLATKEQLVTPELLRRIQHWRRESKDKRIVNFCQVLLEDFGSRIEVTEIQNVPSVVQPSSKETAAGSSDQTIHTAGS